jgi:general secretion pathway protein D
MNLLTIPFFPLPSSYLMTPLLLVSNMKPFVKFSLRSLLAPVMAITVLMGCADRGGSRSAVTVEPTLIHSSVQPLPQRPHAKAKGDAPYSVETEQDVTPKSHKSHIYPGNGVLLKKPTLTETNKSPASVNLNFEGADIRDIAKTVLAEILQENYVVDPKVQGTISLRTVRPLTREALMPTLETVLRMNGIVMIKENDVFKIVPAAAAKGSLSPTMGSASGYTLQVVPLSYVGAREMAKILENVATDPALVKTDEFRNLLIVAGTQNEIRHLLDTVEMFDVDWMSGMSIGLFVLQSADIKSVEQDMKKVFGDKNVTDPLSGVVRFIPIERLNAFVIITPQPKYLEHAKLWLERLDRVGGGGGMRLFVYHVQNGKAEHLAELLNQTFSGQQSQAAQRVSNAKVAPGLKGAQLSTAPTAAFTAKSGLGQAGAVATSATTQTQPAGVSGASLTIADESGGKAEEVRVVADPYNNALLILANTSGYEKIESALKKLDQAPRQVLIELTIAEVTLKDELSYGIEWLFTNGSRRSGKLDLGSAGLNALVPGFSYAVTSATNGSIKSILNMLATDNKVKVLSSPHVMVADNQTAQIQVGDSVPTAGPTVIPATGQPITSVQYLDTGVILAVTPRINAGGLVNLEVVQEVSAATATKTSEINSPTISKRSARTVLSVQSGETIVMGGLISERSSGGSSGLPVLSEIPILGGLFGNQSLNKDRTELILMITPRVANNFNQAKSLSDELRRKMGDVKELVDCGISNSLGFTARGGLWCMQRNGAVVGDTPLDMNGGSDEKSSAAQ